MLDGDAGDLPAAGLDGLVPGLPRPAELAEPQLDLRLDALRRRGSATATRPSTRWSSGPTASSTRPSGWRSTRRRSGC